MWPNSFCAPSLTGRFTRRLRACLPDPGHPCTALQVADSLWGGVPLRGVPGPQQSLDLEDLDVEGGQQHKEEKNPDPGHAGSKPDLDNLVNSSEGEEERDEGADGGSVWASRDLPAVLPYWRPLKVQLKLGARAGKVRGANTRNVRKGGGSLDVASAEVAAPPEVRRTPPEPLP